MSGNAVSDPSGKFRPTSADTVANSGMTEMYIMARQKTEANVRRHNGFYATPPEALCSNEQERCEGRR